MKKIAILILIGGLVSGCAATRNVAEGQAAAPGAPAAVDAVIGQPADPGTQDSSLGAQTGAVGETIVGEHVEKKFCPVCGRRFPASIQSCPYDGAQLQLIETDGE